MKPDQMTSFGQGSNDVGFRYIESIVDGGKPCVRVQTEASDIVSLVWIMDEELTKFLQSDQVFLHGMPPMITLECNTFPQYRPGLFAARSAERTKYTEGREIQAFHNLLRDVVWDMALDRDDRLRMFALVLKTNIKYKKKCLLD